MTITSSINQLHNSYLMPGRLLNGRGGAMHYWHVVYYLLATRPEQRSQHQSVVTNPAELAELSGLDIRQISNERNKSWQQDAPFQLEEYDTTGGIVLAAPHYRAAVQSSLPHEKSYQIPAGLIQNGWLALIWHTHKSRLCIAIINQLLQLPAGKRQLDLAHLAKKCKSPNSKTSPGRDKMLVALEQLGRLGLIKTTIQKGKQWYVLQTHQFNSPATVPTQPTDAQELPPAVQDAFAKDKVRAQRALDCAQAGRFDLDTHFHEIYRDLAYLNWDNESQTFLMRASKWAAKPVGPDRWKQFWSHHFRLRRERDIVRVYSIKEIVDLSILNRTILSINFPKADISRLMYARLLVTADFPDYLWHTSAKCNLELRAAENKPILIITLNGNNNSRKHDLTAEAKNGQNALGCAIDAPETYPESTVSLQLETASFKRKRKQNR